MRLFETARVSSVLGLALAVVGCNDDRATASHVRSQSFALGFAPEQTLAQPDPFELDAFGSAVALSADGSRILVGSQWDDPTSDMSSGKGSARVFVRSGSSWTPESTLLAPEAYPSLYTFGGAVALSADADRALVGADQGGSAHVFVRSGSTWSHEAALTIVPGDGSAFGYSVALSADGSRALVGAFYDDPSSIASAGTARVFRRTGTTWTPEATLSDMLGAANDWLGWSVALSGDATFALVSAVGDDVSSEKEVGSVHVYTRSDTSWSAGPVLYGSMAGEYFGYTVALSQDGARAAIGHASGARLYSISGSSWATDGSISATRLSNIALDAGGTRAVIGHGFGDTRVFERASPFNWTLGATLFDPLVPNYGEAVAISADGRRVATAGSTTGATQAGTVKLFLLDAPVTTGSGGAPGAGGSGGGSAGESAAGGVPGGGAGGVEQGGAAGDAEGGSSGTGVSNGGSAGTPETEAGMGGESGRPDVDSGGRGASTSTGGTNGNAGSGTTAGAGATVGAGASAGGGSLPSGGASGASAGHAGASGRGTGGASSAGAGAPSGPSHAASDTDKGGCGCRVTTRDSESSRGAMAALVALLTLVVRLRRAMSRRSTRTVWT